MADKAEQAADKADLQEQVGALRADIAELAAAMSRFTRSSVESLSSEAKDRLRAAQEAGQERLQAAGDLAGRKYAETEDYIRANPTVAIGIAAAVGFLIGLVTTRR